VCVYKRRDTAPSDGLFIIIIIINGFQFLISEKVMWVSEREFLNERRRRVAYYIVLYHAYTSYIGTSGGGVGG